MDVEKELQEAKEDVNVGQLIGIIEHLQAESERRNELWGVATAKVAEARQEIEQLQSENRRLQYFKNTTVGLWATDRPEKLTQEEYERCCLFELKGGD